MRLNRFIPSPIKFITLTSHVVHYKILGDSSFFFYNHPGSSLINLSTNLQRGSSWRVDARFLQEAKEPIKALWEASPPPKCLSLQSLGMLHKFINNYVLPKQWRLGWKRLNSGNILSFGKFSSNPTYLVRQIDLLSTSFSLN